MIKTTEVTKEIAYLILQDKYLKLIEKDNKTEEEIFSDISEIFPQDWTINYNLDNKIELLGDAIKSKKSLIEVINEKKINK